MGQITPDNTIVITKFPLSTPKKEAFNMCDRDESLVAAILKKEAALGKEDIEVFARQDNIIVTEEGYYGAFYQKDLQKMAESV